MSVLKRKQVLASQCLLWLALVLVASGAFSALEAQTKAFLFDGKSLKGWHRAAGKAQFAVEQDAIVGISVIDSANSFLRTDNEYCDFLLELDVKVESPLSNSGIQTRSHFGGPLHPSKVYGRQIEIDPSARAWTGGIYDEDRREWLYPLTLHPQARQAFQIGVFNHIKILCLGNETKTWINNYPVAAIVDTVDQRGFIALQVHAVKTKQEKGLRVWFKNITIQTSGLHNEKFPDDILVVRMAAKNL